MSQTVFGAQAVVTMLNRAFNNTSPANAVFNNQVATAGSTEASQTAFALQFGNSFAGLTDAQLSTRVLGNLGVLPNAELEAAVTQYFADNGLANRGLVVLQLGQILSTLETAPAPQNIFNDAAKAWNTEVEKSFIYSSSTSSTTPYVGDFAPTPVDQGQTFTLTTGVDNVAGTGGNDTLIADNTGATKQLSVADQINGGAGTDLLKIFLAAADTATGQPTLTSIENVWINGGAVTAYTAATGTTGLTVEAPVANTAATYTLAGQEITLKSVASTAGTTTTIAKAATGTQTSQKITLDGVSGAAAGVAYNTVDVTGAGITTLNLVATGANSTINLANTTGAAVTTLNISGDKNLSLAESAAMAAAVTTVDASAATGNVTLNTAAGTVAAGFKYTGGAGVDTVIFKDDALASLLSGAQLNGGAGTADKIGIFDTALTATETARINQAVGFEVLGLNAAITLDASTLTSIKSFSVDTTALTQTISNMATGSTVTVTAAAPTSLTLGTNVGVTDTSIVLGTAASAGITVGTLVTTGITNVTLTSNGLAANAVTTLTNSDNSVFTLKGGADLTLALAAGTAVGSKIDGSAATGKLTLTGSALTGSGDIIIGGSGNDIINGGKGADTLTGGAGVDTFSFTATAGANAGGATFGLADVITDFVVGTDKLQFAGVTDVVSAQQGAVQTAVSALAAGSSAAAIATAMATANTTNLGVSFAVYEGNTYVLYETTGASTGVAADDVFIKLVGVTTLPTFAADVVA